MNTILDFKGKWDSYHMVVDLTKFMETRSITRMRKLVKYIRESDTPEELTKISDWIQDFLGSYESDQRDRKRLIDLYVRKVKFLEIKLDRDIRLRDNLQHYITFRKVNPDYAEVNKRVKAVRGELKRTKEQIRYTEREYNRCERMKDFVTKVSEVING